MKFKTRPKLGQGQALLCIWCFPSIKHDGKFVVVQQLVWHRCQRSLRPRTCIFMLLSLYSNFDNKSQTLEKRSEREGEEGGEGERERDLGSNKGSKEVIGEIGHARLGDPHRYVLV